ncbi:MAG: DpnD/PcfM family protein [Synergistaceae bacterium]|nr:DpnD/PcfM family protein [Synergistaceae bacterium]MBQ3450041.1 DpnD/PcfM family protein [Synergistaceae bacterium]
MKIYKVAVTEIYRKVVSVEAQNEQEAHQRAWDAWNNTEIILDMNDFEAAEMHVMDEGYELSKKQPDSFIEGYDYGFGKGKGKGTAKNGR